MSNHLSFLEGDAPEANDVQPDAPTAEASAPQPVEAQAPASTPAESPAQNAPGAVRGPDGKFTSAAPAAPVQPPAEPGHVPIAAMLDEREKRQALEKQLAEFKARETAAAQANAPPLPLEAQVQQQLYAANLKASRRFAEREYGKEILATVHDWAAARCDADPIFNAQMRASEDPYEAAMQAYNREKILSGVTSLSELEQFNAWKAAQAGLSPASPAQTVPTPSPAAAAVPRSLANAPGNGSQGHGAVAVGEGNAYAGLFK